VFTSANGANVDERYTTAILPTAASWVANARYTQLKGTPGSVMYVNPSISASGGDGYIIVASEMNTSQVTTRSCFNTPITDAPTTSAPTLGAAIVQTMAPTRSSGVIQGVSQLLTMLIAPLVLLFGHF
jgi:hypothetical protein